MNFKAGSATDVGELAPNNWHIYNAIDRAVLFEVDFASFVNELRSFMHWVLGEK